MSRPPASDDEPWRRRLAGLPAHDLGHGWVLHVAASARARGRGLAGLPDLPAGHALLLRPCRSVHTLGMRFGLDLVWLDAAGGVVRVDRGVGRRRIRTCLRAAAVVEAREGDVRGLVDALQTEGPPCYRLAR